jgi:hypothetical protein
MAFFVADAQNGCASTAPQPVPKICPQGGRPQRVLGVKTGIEERRAPPCAGGAPSREEPREACRRMAGDTAWRSSISSHSPPSDNGEVEGSESVRWWDDLALVLTNLLATGSRRALRRSRARIGARCEPGVVRATRGSPYRGGSSW